MLRLSDLTSQILVYHIRIFHLVYSFTYPSNRALIVELTPPPPPVLVIIVPLHPWNKKNFCFFVYHKLLYRLKINQCLFYSVNLYRFHASFQNILFSSSSSSSSFSVCFSACHSTTAFRIRIRNLHLRLLQHFHFDFKYLI